MKFSLKKMVLFVALCMTTWVVAYGQTPSKIESKMAELVKKYDKVDGVECIKVVKGQGLGLVKMMLSAEIGRDFMKGVTAITIINYSDASPATCQALRNEVEAFKNLLEEFPVEKEAELADNDYIRTFAQSLDERTMSDFVFALEDKESKMIMHMAGKIKAE